MNTKLSIEHKHPLDDNIEFFEKEHKYLIHIDPDVKYTSVTTWIHEHFGKFDSDKIIDTMMKSRKWPSSKYFGMTKPEIKALWDKNAKKVSGEGTLLHYHIECFMNMKHPMDKICHHQDLLDVYEETLPIENSSIEWNFFLDFIKKYPELKPYRTEWFIYDTELKIAGSIDMIYEKEDGTLMIYDWKRCKDISKDNPYHKYALAPFETIPDTNFWHYSLQLNIYKYSLEKNYNKIITDLYLVKLHPENKSNSFELIKLPDLSSTIQDLVEHRKSKII